MSCSQKQEKTSMLKSAGLTPGQTEHLLLGYLCMQKPKIDWKKLAELSNVTPSSARTVFTRGRRSLEKWEKRIAGPATKEEAGEADDEEDADHTKDSDEAVEAAHAEDTEN
ncbi:unnamed protein product [Penicillium glandicola]